MPMDTEAQQEAARAMNAPEGTRIMAAADRRRQLEIMIVRRMPQLMSIWDVQQMLVLGCRACR